MTGDTWYGIYSNFLYSLPNYAYSVNLEVLHSTDLFSERSTKTFQVTEDKR